MTLSPISPKNIIRYCFSDIKTIEDLLLKAYRDRAIESGTLSIQSANAKINILEEILNKLKS